MKKKLLSIVLPALLLLTSQAIAQLCTPPTALSVTAENGTAAVLYWDSEAGTTGEILVLPAGASAPTAGSTGNLGLSPYYQVGLLCGQSYDFYVRTICSDNQITDWSGPLSFLSMENTSLSAMVQGDTDNDGVVIFNLTTIEAQLNTTNTISYFTSFSDAFNNINPIFNTTAFPVATSDIDTVITIRELIPSGCDQFFSIPLIALMSTNMASTCANANSLCSTIGIPYLNTVSSPPAEPGNYACLYTVPNPTWFYIPISEPGSLSLQISQVNINGMGLDVDFIAFGPFASPTCGSSNLGPQNQIGCSYSSAPIENFTILNAQVGEYYMLLVTNFSNQPGTITISQTSGSSAGIDCTGLRMTAYLDSNANGIKDSGEQNFPLGQFHYEINNNGVLHNVTSPSGVHTIYEVNPLNLYDISYSIDSIYGSNYTIATSSFANISVIAGGGLQNYYFPGVPIQNYADLLVSIVPIDPPRPGFDYTNKVIYSNFGSQSVPSGTITFENDSDTTISSVVPAGLPTTTGFTYDFVNLLPFETREITVIMSVPIIPIVNLGDILTNTASIAPLTGDIFPENNLSISSQVVIGSYDPNDKMESRGSEITITEFGPEDYLYYTIRFENTGTASAINVRVLDVLDDSLDASSVRMVNSSHDYTLDRVENSLTWDFVNVLLPPTSQNPILSNGYIHFKVKPNPGYAIGDIILNTASIFFDFNPAIVTNTFISEFVAPLSIGQYENNEFVIYPNPASDQITISMADGTFVSNVSIYDMMGKSILSTVPSAQTQAHLLDINSISTGLYFVEIISSDNKKTMKKLLIQ